MSISLAAGAQSKNGLESQCAKGLDAAYAELDLAKAKGVAGVADMSWAASLLAAAKTQQQFGKYPNCVEKVNRARRIIARAQ
ncbi:MAG TPA: hypothetical protein VJ924_06465 [Alphaproteobacteria bacterium]|nr:hypothetical protein [Alphaproteobacteria bacterium]